MRRRERVVPLWGNLQSHRNQPLAHLCGSLSRPV